MAKEYIEREAAKRELLSWAVCMNHPEYLMKDDALHVIDSIPAADVSPVRHAKWVDNHCTACGMMPMGDEMWENYDGDPPLFDRFMDYCPTCGAKMDGGAE